MRAATVEEPMLSPREAHLLSSVANTQSMMSHRFEHAVREARRQTESATRVLEADRRVLLDSALQSHQLVRDVLEQTARKEQAASAAGQASEALRKELAASEEELRKELALRAAAESSLRAELEAAAVAQGELRAELAEQARALEEARSASATASSATAPSDTTGSDAELALASALEECEHLRLELAEQQGRAAAVSAAALAPAAAPKEAAVATRSPFAGISAVRDIMMWRVELEDDEYGNTTLRIHKVKKSKRGLFNDGDSYLVLDGRNAEATGGVRVILWIGPESELDERKGAASAAMQLEIDLRLGGADVAFLSRVVGGREGSAFRDMWRPGQYRVIAGGSETAYDPADPESWTPVLFHVKGTAKAMRVHKIPSVAAAMNHGDVFMLNAGERVFTWIGCGASAFEMREGRRIGNELSKRQHAEFVVIEDHAAKYVATEETTAFFALLEGDYEHIADDDDDDDDEVEQSIARKLFSMYKLSDEQTGEVEVEALQRDVPLLDKTLLDTDDAFLIDLRSIVVVWVGQGATNQERLGVLAFTEEYLDTCEDDHLSKFTPVVKLDEGDAWPRSMRRAFNPKGSAGISLKAVATTVSAAAAVTSAKVAAAAAASAAAEPPPQAPRKSSKEATPEAAAAAAVVAIEAPAAAVATSAAEEAPPKKKKKKKASSKKGAPPPTEATVEMEESPPPPPPSKSKRKSKRMSKRRPPPPP